MKNRANILKQIADAWQNQWTAAEKITVYTMTISLIQAPAETETDLTTRLTRLESLMLHHVVKNILEFCTDHFDTFQVLIGPFLQASVKPDTRLARQGPEAWSISVDQDEEADEQEPIDVDDELDVKKNPRKRPVQRLVPEIGFVERDKRPRALFAQRKGKRRAEDDGDGPNVTKHRRMPPPPEPRKVSSTALTCLEECYGHYPDEDDEEPTYGIAL
uniref:Uncharacterized protein n=1 Tax=viral metagenome TaxID=1070528 RepID=A0A6C0BQ85_9ZZZZ